MDKDDLWIVENFSELVTKHAGKYIAVVNQALVAVGESGAEVEVRPVKSSLARCHLYCVSLAKRIWHVSYRISLHFSQTLLDADYSDIN